MPTRRDVLRSGLSAAAMLLCRPIVSLAVNQPVNLKKFCDIEEINRYDRYDLRNPFVQGEWTYATDARVCVRVPGVMGVTDSDSEFRFPRAGGLNWNPTSEPWKPWPKRDWIKVRDNHPGLCPFCRATGRIGDDVRECPKCEPEGRLLDWHVLRDGGVFVEGQCPSCRNVGFVGGTICENCNGTGEFQDNLLQSVGDVHLCAGYDNMIRELPGVRFQHRPVKCFTGIETAVAFRFDGGEGLVMPDDILK